MARYRSFEHQVKEPLRVKVGFCWPAFFFTVFYLATMRMWRWFGIWCVVWLAGTLVFALRYSPSMQEYYPILNPLVLVTNWVFHLIPGFFANRWRISTLAQQGYVEAGPNGPGLVGPEGAQVPTEPPRHSARSGVYHGAVVIAAAVLVAAMVLFPPYLVKYGGNIIATGYGLIFDLPVYMDKVPAQVNVATLGAQVAGVLVVAGLLYVAKRRN